MQKKNLKQNNHFTQHEISSEREIVSEAPANNINDFEGTINEQYYFQYKKSYNTGLVLSIEMEELISIRDELWGQLSKLEERTMEFKDIIRGQHANRKRRPRRPAEQIERIFKCSQHGCEKSYGSEGSLHQHIRLKHLRGKPQKKQQQLN